jgi:hypothetical protein
MSRLSLLKRKRTEAPENKITNNGGLTEGVVKGGVMSLEIFISTKREKMKLITLATKRASK